MSGDVAVRTGGEGSVAPSRGRGRPLVIVTVLFLIAVGLAVFTAVDFLGSSPPTVNFTANHQPGTPVRLHVQTVGTIGFGPHPTWVSYLTQDPSSGQWVHTTLWQLPAHTLVNVTLYQYDSGSPLRNQQWGQIQGTVGGVALYNGRAASVINSNGTNGVGHTFSVPTLGISVPLLGINPNAKNPCGAAPCTPSFNHNLIRFSFRTPGPGRYAWQCFVPCGLGFLFGNGGPMSTVGYMGGFLEVNA
jgi:hypothetical protein